MKYVTSARFSDLCCRVGVEAEKSQGIFSALIALYSQGYRTYHNLSHIDRMLSWLDKSRGGSDVIELAIWFHDAVYEPLARDNEEESAQYFTTHVGSLVDDSLITDVTHLILATDPRQSRSGAADEDLIVDIDLSILGSPPEDYDTYRTAVRNEYSSVSDSDFRARRISVLQNFLSEQIYATQLFGQLEKQARDNIKAELVSLELTQS